MQDAISKLRTNTGFMTVWNAAKKFATLHNIVPPNLSHSLDTTIGKRRRTTTVFPGFVAYSLNGMLQIQMSTRTVNSAHT